MEKSQNEFNQIGIFSNPNTEELLYESFDYLVFLSLDAESCNNDKAINIKITDKYLNFDLLKIQIFKSCLIFIAIQPKFNKKLD